MAKASTVPSAEFHKLIYVGTSGTGKTGSLASLVKAGYNLRVLDMDNGIGPLLSFVKRESPELLDNVDVIQCRDKLKADAQKGASVAGSPKAYTDAIKFLTKWDDDSIPSEWGPQTILVVDSLTLLGRAAFRWAHGMDPTCKDPRQWYNAAQQSILTVLDMLTSADFKAHVIVISHVDLVELPDGTTKGYTSSIGKAIGPKIPAVFNNMILAESKGTGENVKRTITTMPTQLLDLKNEMPFTIPKSLPLETGMATIFAALSK
jgi:hypothetical protein